MAAVAHHQGGHPGIGFSHPGHQVTHGSHRVLAHVNDGGAQELAEEDHGRGLRVAAPPVTRSERGTRRGNRILTGKHYEFD